MKVLRNEIEEIKNKTNYTNKAESFIQRSNIDFSLGREKFSMVEVKVDENDENGNYVIYERATNKQKYKFSASFNGADEVEAQEYCFLGKYMEIQKVFKAILEDEIILTEEEKKLNTEDFIELYAIKKQDSTTRNHSIQYDKEGNLLKEVCRNNDLTKIIYKNKKGKYFILNTIWQSPNSFGICHIQYQVLYMAKKAPIK